MWTIYFLDGQCISSLQCKWKKLPKSSIIKFVFHLNKTKSIILEGFESYLCFKEIYNLVTSGKQKVDTINILAKYNNKVCQISYNISHKKILQKTNIWGKEFTPLIWHDQSKRWDSGKARKTNRNLWKVGIKLNNAKIQLLK